MPLELTYKEENLILQNSVERVINTSVELVDSIDAKEDDALNDRVETNLGDWEELKWLVVKLWNDARNEVFKKREAGTSATAEKPKS